jgi:hypothetical protein
MPILPALRRLRKEDDKFNPELTVSEFKDSMGDTVRQCPPQKANKQGTPEALFHFVLTTTATSATSSTIY